MSWATDKVPELLNNWYGGSGDSPGADIIKQRGDEYDSSHGTMTFTPGKTVTVGYDKDGRPINGYYDEDGNFTQTSLHGKDATGGIDEDNVVPDGRNPDDYGRAINHHDEAGHNGGGGWHDNYNDFMDPNGSFQDWWAKASRAGISGLETFFPFLRLGRGAVDALGGLFPGSGGGGGNDWSPDGGSGDVSWGGDNGYDSNWDPFNMGGDYTAPEYRDPSQNPNHGGDWHAGGPTSSDNGGNGNPDYGGPDEGGGGGNFPPPGNGDSSYLPHGQYDYGYSAGPVRMAGGSATPNINGVDLNALMRMLQGGG